MNYYRWIFFPLIFGLLLAAVLPITFAIIGLPSLGFGALLGLICGALAGFGIQFYNEYQTKKIVSDPSNKDFDINQKEILALFYGADESFDLCVQFISEKLNAKAGFSDRSQGIIEARTRMSWDSNGNNVKIFVRKLTENLTEIEIATTPAIPSSFMDMGGGVRIIEEAREYFESLNGEVRENALPPSSIIPIELNSEEDSKVKIDR